MKGQIPSTGIMTLKSEEYRWRALASGIIQELKTSGVIELLPEKKVKIDLLITTIIPPELAQVSCLSKIDSNFDINTSRGLNRTRQFLYNHIDKKVWIFMGHIIGNEKKPIYIVFYEVLNMFIYAQKLIEEDAVTFFQDINLN